MPSLQGVVTIVQEGRFQLVDDHGAAHLFILGPTAGAETSQLAPLSRDQTRIRVTYEDAGSLIAMQAKRIEVVR